jgi:hypothetical protein
VDARVSVTVQSSPGTHPANCTVVMCILKGVKRTGRSANHPLHLESRLKEEYRYASTPFWAFIPGYRMKLTFYSVWETSTDLGRMADMKLPTESVLSQALWIFCIFQAVQQIFANFTSRYPGLHAGLHSKQAEYLCDEVRNYPIKPALCWATSTFRGCVCRVQPSSGLANMLSAGHMRPWRKLFAPLGNLNSSISTIYQTYYYYYYYVTAIGLTSGGSSIHLHTNSTQNTEDGTHITITRKK